MSTTEDRLVAALAARAEQVQLGDLRTTEVPGPPDEVTFLRRPAAYGVGVAAAAAAIAAPFLIGAIGDGHRTVPPAQSPTHAPQADIGRDWPVTDRARADLDGDGVSEQVRVRSEPGKPLIGPRVRIEADLSSGRSVFGIVESGGVSVNIVDPIDGDGDAGQELVLNRDEDDTSEWLVLDLVDGQLVQLDRRTDAPLSTGPVPAEGAADHAFQTERWIKDGALYSSRSLLSYPLHGMEFDLPSTYEADIWSWRVEGGKLAPVSQGALCLSAGDDGSKGQPCAGGSGHDVPALFPEATELISVGESFKTDVDFDGKDDTVSLEGPDTGDGVEDGEVDLVVTTSTAGEKRFPIPAGWAPQVYARTIQVGPLDGLSLLVQQEGGDSSTLTYVATGPSGFAGDLVAVETTGAPFGSGFREDGTTPYDTWVGADGRLYTTIGPEVGSDAAVTPAQVFVWTLRPGPRLEAVDLGSFCVDQSRGVVTRCD